MKNMTIDLRKKHLPLLMILCGLGLAGALYIHNQDNSFVPASTATESGWRFEPEVPRDIDDPPFHELPRPSQIHSVEDVMISGKDIPVRFAYNDPEWKRQAYKSYWHSSVGRWSYVPNRIHYAMHRLFITYPTASAYYDFIHDLGIADESEYFDIPYANPHDNIVVVIMQTSIDKIITFGNQVVISGRPSPTGLRVVLIPVQVLEPYDRKESILLQLVTKDGDELDSTSMLLG